MRQALGIAVFSGMLGVTLFGIFLTPVFFSVIDWLDGRHAVFSHRMRRSADVDAAACTPLELTFAGRLARARSRTRCSRRRHVARAVADRLRPDRRGDPRRSSHRATEDDRCSLASSSTGRSSPRCCRSSSPWPAASRSFTLPVAQYPEITPPTVEVSAVYPGANAQVVADTVAAPIEQQVNGVEDMMYMSSQCTNDGTYTLTVTFKLGIDLNMAQVLVQNRGHPGPADPARPGQAPRRDGQEEVAQHADDRQPVLARRAARDRPLPEQLRHDPAPRRAGPAARASATSPTSASATTACGSGSTRRRWRAAT